MKLRSLPVSALALGLALVATAACRDSGGDDGDDIDAAGGDGNGGQTRVQDVQNDAMPAGTAVTLKGVVVTAVDRYGGRKGNFYVADPAGGEYSGILVYGAPLDQVDALAVGDLVDISGAEKDEFSLADDDATVTELVPVAGGAMTVAKVGTGTAPAPHVVDALAVGQMAKAAREAEYEKWEGVLIRVENVSVLSALRDIGSTDPDFQGFGITGLYEVDSSLAAIPQMPDLVAQGDCLASITGMGDYFYEYKVLPRATEDIVAGGTGCPAPESACSDTIDNDANGFADCMDNTCSRNEPTCQTSSTVVNIQNGTIAVNSTVNLSNVVVTAVSSNRKNIWVADSLAGAQYNGIYVFRGNAAGVAALPAEVVVGARVDVTGRVLEFNSGGGTGTLTQIGNSPTVTFVSAPAGLPTPVTGVSIATLIDDATGEPYEGVLVEITNVKVTSAANNFGVRQFDANAFVSDDDIAQLAQPNDTCFALIRGVWSYDVYDDKWAILPLSGGAPDVVTGGTCP